MGNIEAIGVAYSRAKANIVYDSFQTIMVAIVVFLIFLKIYEEYQKQIENQKRLDLGAFWGQVRIYVLVCFISSFSGQIFTLTESICGDLQTKLINNLGGDTNNKTFQTMEDLVRYNANVAKKEEVGKSLNNPSSTQNPNSDPDSVLKIDAPSSFTVDGGGFILEIIFSIFSGIAMGIGLFIFKYTYTFFIIGRYMWLLMLELVAPIAIVLCIHETTRSYFFTWVKNMIICYMLIPMFLLADSFSNEVAGFSMEGKPDDALTTFLIVATGVWVKIKMFSVVSNKASQLF
jgi:type IV secretory pathway VirB6-like protein